MKLLVLDVEGTIFKPGIRLPGTSLSSTIWQAIAHALGPQAVCEEIQTHDRWSNGKYDSYLDWMEDTILIHREYGLKQQEFNSLIAAAEYNQGVLETLSQIDQNQFEIVLISGGFRELAARAQRDLGIRHAFAACEYLFGEDGVLHAFNLLPCDFEGKIDFIRLLLREHKLSHNDWFFVGDGANDAPVATEAPVSIGYRPHPHLSEVCDFVISDFADLLSILLTGTQP